MITLENRLDYIREAAKRIQKEKQTKTKQNLATIDQTLRNLELLNDHIAKTNYLLKEVLRWDTDLNF